MLETIYDSDDACVFCGDCLELLKSLPDQSVDLVLTSPPYAKARTYSMGFSLSGEDWVKWAFERYMECVRVCKGLVCWVVEGQTRDYRYTAEPVMLMADLHRAGVKLRKPPIYRRVGIPGSGGPDWLRNDYEFVICSAHGKLPWSDNLAMGKPPKYGPGGNPSHRTKNGNRANKKKSVGGGAPDGYANGDTVHGRPYTPPALGNPGNVIQRMYTAQEMSAWIRSIGYTLDNPVAGDIIDCKAGGGHMGSDLSHENEAPFPETLTEFMVRSFCPPNGLVLDIFGGSGTALASAIKHGRKAAACDVRIDQCELMLRRIEEARKAVAA